VIDEREICRPDHRRLRITSRSPSIRAITEGILADPRLHVAMHRVVASQVLAGGPPQTWQTVQRLAGLGYDWHNIMHMIASRVTGDVYWALTEPPVRSAAANTRSSVSASVGQATRREDHPVRGHADGQADRTLVQRKQTCGDHAAELSTSCWRSWQSFRAVTLDGCAG